jgi:hypothetical protein
MDEGLRRMRMAACKSIKCAYFSSEIIYPSSQQDQNIVKKNDIPFSVKWKMLPKKKRFLPVNGIV